MTKFVVIHNGRTAVVEATSPTDAIKKFCKETLAASIWGTDAKVYSRITGKCMVHELDDGMEFQLEGSYDIRISRPAQDEPIDEVSTDTVRVRKTRA